MPKNLFKPPKHLVDEWPEVFKDLYMNTMPVVYLEYVYLEFNTGMVWKVDIKEQLKELDPDTVADMLYSTIQEYKDDVETLDFKVDIKKLKKDIFSSTSKIL